MIRSEAGQYPIRWLLLVGDAPAVGGRLAEDDSAGIATHRIEARLNVLYGSDPEIASDNPYADLDGDQLPDIAVGRLPVDDAGELKLLVRRIIDYEKQQGPADWKSRVHFIAGVGGFGLIADKALEAVTRQLIGGGLPSSYSSTMTYASWQSPYCPDPRHFDQAVISRMNEGSLFWVYIGHGSRGQLDRVVVPGSTHHIMAAGDIGRVDCRQGSPIAIFLACYTGAYDGSRDCMAEQLLRNPRGPIAVYAGSRVTMPYAMAVMGESLMRQVFQQRRATLGEVVLHAKRDLGQQRPANATLQRRTIDLLARTLYPLGHDLALERQEHLALFNLLGDPLLRIPYPGEIDVSAEGAVDAGQQLLVSVNLPHAGRLKLALVCQRGEFPFDPPRRLEYLAEDRWLSEFHQTYEMANRPWWIVKDYAVKSGSQRLDLTIPAGARGSCVLQVLLKGRRGWAVGAKPVYIRASGS